MVSKCHPTLKTAWLQPWQRDSSVKLLESSLIDIGNEKKKLLKMSASDTYVMQKEIREKKEQKCCVTLRCNFLINWVGWSKKNLFCVSIRTEFSWTDFYYFAKK